MSSRIILVAILLLFVSGAANYILVKQNNTLSEERHQLVKAADDSGRIARTYINLHGIAVSKNQVLELDLKNAKDLRNTPGLSFTKEITGVKKNLSNLDETLRLDGDAKLNLTLTPNVVWNHLPPDTVTRVFPYKDKFNSLNIKLKHDSLFVKGEISVPIKGVVYWQRKHYFIFKKLRYGRKEYFTEIYCDNPWVTIKDHELIKIQRK